MALKNNKTVEPAKKTIPEARPGALTEAEQAQKRELAKQKREDQQNQKAPPAEIPEFGGLTGGTAPRPLTPQTSTPQKKAAEKKNQPSKEESGMKEGVGETPEEGGGEKTDQRAWGKDLSAQQLSVRQQRQFQDQETIQKYEKTKKEREELGKKLSEEEQGYARRQLLRLQLLQRNLRLARQLPQAAMAMARQASRQGTGQILKLAWLNLIPSFGLTLIYINFHFIMAYLGGPFAEYFCKFGEEWLTAGVPGGGGGTTAPPTKKPPEKSPNEKKTQKGEQKTTTGQTESASKSPAEETAEGEGQRGSTGEGDVTPTAGRSLEILEIILFLFLDFILAIIIFLIIVLIGTIAYIITEPLEAVKLIFGLVVEIIRAIF